MTSFLWVCSVFGFTFAMGWLLKFHLRYPAAISIHALIGIAACFYVWGNSGVSTGSFSEPAAGIGSAVKASSAPPSLPRFSASDPTSLEKMQSALKRCSAEGRLTQGMVFDLFDELKEGGGSGKQIEDFAEFVRSLVPFDCEGYLRICSYLSAGNEKALLTEYAARAASPEDISRITETWKAIQDDALRSKIGQLLIEKFYSKPDNASITHAFELIDGSMGDDHGRSELKYHYAFKLQWDLRQSESDPGAGMFSQDELLDRFSGREAVPLLSYYASKAMESGDISKLEDLLGDDPKYKDSVIWGALSIAKAIAPDVAVTILERIPDDEARIDRLKSLAEAVKRQAGVVAAARFAQEHFTASEIKSIGLSL